MAKKILYISTRYPFPVKSGREKMINQFIKFVSNKFDIYFAYFSKHEEEKSRAFIRNYNIKKIYKLDFPNILEIFFNLITRKNTSLQEKLFYSRKTEKIIMNIINEIKPDLIVTDMIRTAQYVENQTLKKILDMDDLLSIRYIRYQTLNKTEDNLLGTFQNILPTPLNHIFDKKLKNFILKIEAAKMKKREIELSNKFNAILLVSPKESEYLKNLTNNPYIFAFPPAIELHKNIYNPHCKKNNFLFIGNMKTSQNLSSIKLILEKMFPILIDKMNFKLKIVGSYDDRLKKLVEPYSKYVDLLGFVENMEEIIKESKLLLSPIAFGTGIKTKILDAMSYGLPVVTNSVGVEGLKIKNFEECIVEDDFQKIPDLLIDVLSNPELLSKVSNKGYEYVLKFHNPNLIQRRLLSIINQVLEEK